ncbi:MAG: FliM/FliN family flagellar motor switch protein [Pseudomonadota bacterium]
MADADTKPSVTERLLDAAGIQIDRLPMLPVIFDRVANMCVDQMRLLAPSPCFFSMSHIEQEKITDILEAYEANAVCAILDVPEWDSQVVVGFERDFIFTIVETMFGADGSEMPEEDGRVFSNIEMKICQRLAEMMCTVLTQAFASTSKATFSVERLETRMHFAVVGRRNGQAAAAKFLVQAINRGGEMFIILPHSCLQMIRQSLSKSGQNEPGTRDPGWVSQMKAGATRAEVKLDAILDKTQLTLGELSELQVGDLIELNATPRSKVKLSANDQPVFWAQLGQSEGVFRLKIETVFNPQEEFLGDILNH